MQFRLAKDAARKALSYILNVVGGDSTVLITTADKYPNKVIIEGAGKGTYVSIKLDSETLAGAQGTVPVDGSHLSTIKFPADVVFQSDGTKLFYESNTFKGNMALSTNGGYVKTQRPRDNPNQPLHWFNVNKDMLVAATKATVFEPNIKGVNDGITLKFGDKLVMYAFDGLRASLYVENLPEPVEPVTCVLAPKFFDAITKLTTEGDTIQMAVDGGSIRIKTATILISYPQLQVETTDVHGQIQGLFQNAIEGEFTVAAKKLTNTLTSMASVVHGGIDFNHHFRFSILPEEQRIALALNADTGQVTDSILIEGPMRASNFVLPGKHLAELLPLMSGDVLIRLYTAGSARMISFSSIDGKSTILMSVVNVD